MKAKHRYVAEGANAVAADLRPERVRGIIDDAQSVTLRDLTNPYDIAWNAVDMNSQNARSPIRDEFFNASWINRHRFWIHIAEDRCDPVPRQNMRSGLKSEWSG